MNLINKRKARSVEKSRERLLKQKTKMETRGNKERAQMERNSNPKKIRMLSGLWGNEEFVQNVWIILPVRMTREEFRTRFNRGFCDVGEI